MLTHWLNFFTVTKRISGWHDLCKWKFLYIVNSAGGSFCWNYVTDALYTNYAGDKVCCNYESFEALLQLCTWYFLYSYVGGSFCCNHACDCFCCNYCVCVKRKKLCNCLCSCRFFSPPSRRCFSNGLAKVPFKSISWLVTQDVCDQNRGIP